MQHSCAVIFEAKQKVLSNVVDTLSDILEIDSEDKVQLSVSADSDLGTIYSITVPVRRLKPEYYDEEDLEALSLWLIFSIRAPEEDHAVLMFYIPDEKYQ